MNYVSTIMRPEWGPQDVAEERKTSLLSQFTQALFRRRKLAAYVAAGAFLAIFGGALLQAPRYTATALVMISPTQARVVSPEQSLTESRDDSATVETAIEMLRSPYLAGKLATAMNLQNDPRWTSKPEKNADASVESAVVRHVMRSISVRRRAMSYVVEVRAKAPTAKQAAEMANTLVGLYQTGLGDLRANTMEAADTWLSRRLEELRGEVQRKEAAAAKFRAESGLLNSGAATLSELQIANIQTSVLSARAELAEKVARYNQVAQANRRGNADTLGSALSSETIRELRAREADLTRRQADIESRYTELHPNVQTGRVELANIRSRITAEIARIATSASNDVEVSRSRLAALEASLGGARGELIADNGAQVQLRELERGAAASRAVYESFLKRHQEIAEQGKLGPTDATVISEAKAPKSPASPKPALAFLIALALSAAAGVGAAFLIDRLADGLGDPDDLQAEFGLPVLASIPFVPRETLEALPPSQRTVGEYLVAKPLTRFAEANRMLRAAVMMATPDQRSRTIAITSALANESKSTTALCLVRVAAMAGQRAVLVDCDFRNPSIPEFFGIAPRTGLQDVLAGSATWRQVIGADQRTGAHVIPATASEVKPDGSFNGDALRTLLEELREEYDLVVLNCAPVLLVADTIFLAPQVDRVVLVAHWGHTSRSAVRAAIESLVNARATIMGLVLNCVDFRDWNGRIRTSRYYTREPATGAAARIERVVKGVANAVAKPY